MTVGSDDPTKRRDLTVSSWRVLVFWDGGSESHDLRPDARLLIGRGDDCDLCVPSESVSRRHAVLSGSDGVWRIEDLESSNGTFVGAARLEKGAVHPIEPGRVVKLGDARLLLDGGGPSLAPSRPSRAAESLDEAMERVLRLVDLVADSPLSVLLLGETGVGKGHLAEAIHRRSSRAQAPFVRMNCAAIPEALIESELFGHERGSFTGAAQAKPGLLETADGGTVFLDEIGELPRPTQAKLLHVLEHAEVLRVGGLRPRPIDVRFVSATNRDVESLMNEGALRRDLYFRIAGVPVLVPPLRERRSEIAALAEAFVADACKRSTRLPPSFSPAALARLASYAWPGNLRELRNVVARAALLCGDGPMSPEHLLLDHGERQAGVPPLAAPQPNSPTLIPPPAAAIAHDAPIESRRLGAELKEFERLCLQDALERFGGHQGKAAEHMGISRRTLTNKLNKLGMPRPRKRSS